MKELRTLNDLTPLNPYQSWRCSTTRCSPRCGTAALALAEGVKGFGPASGEGLNPSTPSICT